MGKRNVWYRYQGSAESTRMANAKCRRIVVRAKGEGQRTAFVYFFPVGFLDCHLYWFPHTFGQSIHPRGQFPSILGEPIRDRGYVTYLFNERSSKIAPPALKNKFHFKNYTYLAMEALSDAVNKGVWVCTCMCMSVYVYVCGCVCVCAYV